MSATHSAYGSIRMEPVFMVLGQSAAIAAALAIDAHRPVQDVDITELRKILKNDPYLDGSTPEILVDDTDIDKIKRNGQWGKRFGGHYKNSFVYAANPSFNSKFTFCPAVKKPGKYTIYFYCTQLPDKELPDSLYLSVQHEGGVHSLSLAPGEHKGGWAKLGTYTLGKQSAVTVDGELTKGPVFADAILLIPDEKH
jgi:hypothetical protein